LQQQPEADTDFAPLGGIIGQRAGGEGVVFRPLPADGEGVVFVFVAQAGACGQGMRQAGAAASTFG